MFKSELNNKFQFKKHV